MKETCPYCKGTGKGIWGVRNSKNEWEIKQIKCLACNELGYISRKQAK